MTAPGLEIAGSADLADTVRLHLRGRAVDEPFRLDVALPNRPRPPGGAHPVVWIGDGNSLFAMAVQIHRQLVSMGEARPAVLVGVGYRLDDVHRPRNAQGALRTRDFTPTDARAYLDHIAAQRGGRPLPIFGRAAGGADAFLRFLIDEARPALSAYLGAESGEHILAGCSLGGLFSLNAMLRAPGAFAGHIVSSPSLWWDERVTFSRLEAFAATPATRPVQVFMGVGGTETDERWGMVQNLQAFAAELRALKRPGLCVIDHVFPDETHASVIPAALSRGLRTLLAA